MHVSIKYNIIYDRYKQLYIYIHICMSPGQNQTKTFTIKYTRTYYRTLYCVMIKVVLETKYTWAKTNH